jgi:hypothetical protein
LFQVVILQKWSHLSGGLCPNLFSPVDKARPDLHIATATARQVRLDLALLPQYSQCLPLKPCSYL